MSSTAILNKRYNAETVLKSFELLHWTKSRISLCFLYTFWLYPAAILERIEPNFLQHVGNMYEIGSILQISCNEEIQLFAQCIIGNMCPNQAEFSRCGLVNQLVNAFSLNPNGQSQQCLKTS